MNLPFCIFPFKAMSFTPSGMAKPCCSFDGYVADPAGQPMKLGEFTADEIWNAPFMESLRRSMSAGLPVKGCELCAWHEELGVTSVGRSMTEAWRNGFLNEARERLPLAGEQPQWLDVHLGNACNLKCRTCSPAYSSAISADPAHAAWTPADERPGRWFRDSRTLYRDVFRNPDRLRALNLSGGEPLLIKEARELLRRLIAAGAAKRIHLSFVTNGTVVDEEFCSLAAEFKRVFVMISLDGVGEVNEYLRFNSKWAEVEAGVRRLRQLRNADFCVNTVVSAYNMLHLPKLIRYCGDQGLPWEFALLESPPHLGSTIMPRAIRDEAVRRLGESVVEPQVISASRLGQLQAAWTKGSPESSAMLEKFLRFTGELDASRRQNFERVFPDLREMLHSAVSF